MSKRVKIWHWFCCNDSCVRKDRPVKLPVNKIPRPCKSCGEDNWRKPSGPDGESYKDMDD